MLIGLVLPTSVRGFSVVLPTALTGQTADPIPVKYKVPGEGPRKYAQDNVAVVVRRHSANRCVGSVSDDGGTRGGEEEERKDVHHHEVASNELQGVQHTSPQLCGKPGPKRREGETIKVPFRRQIGSPITLCRCQAFQLQAGVRRNDRTGHHIAVTNIAIVTVADAVTPATCNPAITTTTAVTATATATTGTIAITVPRQHQARQDLALSFAAPDVGLDQSAVKLDAGAAEALEGHGQDKDADALAGELPGRLDIPLIGDETRASGVPVPCVLCASGTTSDREKGKERRGSRRGGGGGVEYRTYGKEALWGIRLVVVMAAAGGVGSLGHVER